MDAFVTGFAYVAAAVVCVFGVLTLVFCVAIAVGTRGPFKCVTCGWPLRYGPCKRHYRNGTPRKS